jgi:hypothetical protein
MAKLVDFRTFTPKDSRDDLACRLQEAPNEHAEALLAGYDLLQRPQEKGIIDLLNGLLSAGDTVVERVVDVISSREAVIALGAHLREPAHLYGSRQAPRSDLECRKQRAAIADVYCQTGDLEGGAPRL